MACTILVRALLSDKKSQYTHVGPAFKQTFDATNISEVGGIEQSMYSRMTVPVDATDGALYCFYRHGLRPAHGKPRVYTRSEALESDVKDYVENVENGDVESDVDANGTGAGLETVSANTVKAAAKAFGGNKVMFFNICHYFLHKSIRCSSEPVKI